MRHWVTIPSLANPPQRTAQAAAHPDTAARCQLQQSHPIGLTPIFSPQSPMSQPALLHRTSRSLSILTRPIINAEYKHRRIVHISYFAWGYQVLHSLLGILPPWQNQDPLRRPAAHRPIQLMGRNMASN